ncbi:MAG: putative photosynthetic complex assembly protein PuhE [Hyphomicrobiaceae bacterium]
MLEYGVPVLAAVALWWLSTGVILYLDGLPTSTFRWSMLGASILAAAALAGLVATRDMVTPLGAYLAFACGLIVWGWQAMSFYMGYITGPRTTACPPHCTGWQRFWAACETNITHEICIAAGALALVAITDGAGNQLGVWTYVVLWWMHLSGKLNVFLGVPNLSEEFIPEHLAYLRSYMARRPMNLLFPFSVTISTLVTGWLFVLAARQVPGSFEAIAYTLIATLMVLAVLEHWLLVLPLQAMALWNWSLASRPPQARLAGSDAVDPLEPELRRQRPHVLIPAPASPAAKPSSA